MRVILILLLLIARSFFLRFFMPINFDNTDNNYIIISSQLSAFHQSALFAKVYYVLKLNDNNLNKYYHVV